MLLAALLCPGAMAMDIKRGDRGEMVANVQEMLLQMGWLQDDPDGIFGKNTQQAVMDFEAAHYFPVDGIVEDELYEAICVAWEAAQQEDMDENRVEESNGAYDEVVFLNNNIIIYGDKIYYSGSVSGRDQGVYIIDTYTRNSCMISDVQARLKALCNDNLLIQYRNPGEDEYALGILDMDGNIIPLSDGYCNYAIESYGRFYWNQGSCNWDGSDLRILFGEEEARYICPIMVEGDYLYYEDGAPVASTLYELDMDYIPNAQIWRMNLEDGSRQMISDAGSKFLGNEDGRFYYARENYWTKNADGIDTEYLVEEGVYRVNLDTLETVCLQNVEERDCCYTYWYKLVDGVIYSEYEDCSGEYYESYIHRIDTDGNIIYELPLFHATTDRVGIVNGVWYAPAVPENAREVLVCVNLEDGSRKVVPFEEAETLYYAEGVPDIAVVDDVIYYYCKDEELDAYCLKSMDLSGGDKALYAYRDASYLPY